MFLYIFVCVFDVQLHESIYLTAFYGRLFRSSTSVCGSFNRPILKRNIYIYIYMQ